jgi:hypothetical protein
MTDVLSTDLTVIKTNDNVSVYLFEISSIALSTSDEIELPVSLKGIIRGIRVVNSSDDYTISIRTDTGITTPSVKELLKVENIDESYNNVSLWIPYVCSEALYLNIANDDGAHATGDFNLELLISIAG